MLFHRLERKSIVWQNFYMKKYLFILVVASALLSACSSSEKAASEQVNSTPAKSKNYYTINGKAVRLLPNTVAGADRLFQFFNVEKNEVIPFPKDVVGYQQMDNSETRFNAAVNTAKGYRFKYESEVSDYPPCLQVRERFYSEIGPMTRIELILCKNEDSRWVPLEMRNTKTGNNLAVNTLPASETEEAAIKVAGAFYEKKKLDGYTADSSSKCMSLYIGERDACFLNVAGDPLFNYLLSQENPNVDTLSTTIATKSIPASTKKLLEKKLLSLSMKSSNSSSKVLGVALQNPNLTEAERKTLHLKWLSAQVDEIEAARNELRKCVKTANTWASIRERACAKQLGGEEWLTWLEKDSNAPSADLAQAIADSKKIGRSTTKLEENYKHVLRSEADKAYYADKYKREQQEKEAFGNISKIMQQVRDNYSTYCAQNPQTCQDNSARYIENYHNIMWQQGLKTGGPSWDQIRSGR